MDYYKITLTYNEQEKTFIVCAYHELQAERNLIKIQRLNEDAIEHMEVVKL